MDPVSPFSDITTIAYLQGCLQLDAA